MTDSILCTIFQSLIKNLLKMALEMIRRNFVNFMIDKKGQLRCPGVLHKGEITYHTPESVLKAFSEYFFSVKVRSQLSSSFNFISDNSVTVRCVTVGEV